MYCLWRSIHLNVASTRPCMAISIMVEHHHTSEFFACVIELNALTASDTGEGRSSAPHLSLAQSQCRVGETNPDRKSTRLNSSHQIISYAVFCLKKKKKTNKKNHQKSCIGVFFIDYHSIFKNWLDFQHTTRLATAAIRGCAVRCTWRPSYGLPTQ